MDKTLAQILITAAALSGDGSLPDLDLDSIKRPIYKRKRSKGIVMTPKQKKARAKEKRAKQARKINFKLNKR